MLAKLLTRRSVTAGAVGLALLGAALAPSASPSASSSTSSRAQNAGTAGVAGNGAATGNGTGSTGTGSAASPGRAAPTPRGTPAEPAARTGPAAAARAEPGRSGKPGGRARESGGAGLTRFYEQRVTWTTCPGTEDMEDGHEDPESPDAGSSAEAAAPSEDASGFQCGKVTVPLDYAHPSKGTLELALGRYRTTGRKAKGSVVLNFGGPGGPGVGQLAAAGDAFMGLAKEYDVVSFDPRGVGRSSPVSCGDDESMWGTRTSEAAALLRQLKQIAAACAKHSGPVLDHIGTVDVARDLDVVRAALGDDKLTYLGFSYGTRLGAVYAAQFPDKVRRLALDGVDTLTEPLTEQGLAGAEGQQKALEEFITWCAEDIACPFGQDPRRGREEVVRLIRALDEEPVPSAWGHTFSGQDLVGAISQALYSRALWPLLERALAQLVEDGDTRGVEGFWPASGSRPAPLPPLARPDGPPSAARPHAPSGTGSPSSRPTGEHTGLTDEHEIPMDNLPAALMAVNCADDPDRPTAESITRDLGRLRAAYEEASPVFGQFRLTEVLACYGRPKGTDYIREKVRDVDTPKLLLVGTRGDPATPYRWTVETAKRLGDAAVVLDNKGDGHTGYASSRCVRDKVDAYLLYGSLPPDGSSCGAEDTRR